MKLKLNNVRCFYNPRTKTIKIFYLTNSKEIDYTDIPLNCELEPVDNKLYRINVKNINRDEFINYVFGFEHQNEFKSFISYLFNKYDFKISLVD